MITLNEKDAEIEKKENESDILFEKFEKFKEEK